MTDAAADASAGGWWRRTFISLRVRNFRLFFFGQLISNSGNWLTMVAVTLLVLHRTHSGFYVGLLSAFMFGPMLFLSPFAGVVADRSDKRKLLYVTQSAEMVQSIALAILAFIPGSPLWLFFLVALFGGCMLAFDNPARRSFVNEMVPPSLVPNAVTLYSALVNLSRLIGPSLAAGLIVAVGYGWCFALDAASYLTVLVALAMMRPSELRETKRTPRGRGQVREGLRYVLDVPELRIVFLLQIIVGVVSYNFTVALPLFVERGLHGSDATFSLIYAVFSAGAVAGTLVIARQSTIRLRTTIISTAALGLTMGLMTFVPNIGLAYPAAALVGATSVAFLTTTTALVQLRSEERMVGRVLALQTVVLIGTTPIGGPLLGLLADASGGRAPMLLGGVGALVAAAVGVMLGRQRLAVGGQTAEPADAVEAAG
jgi:MFS family permease